MRNSPRASKTNCVASPGDTETVMPLADARARVTRAIVTLSFLLPYVRYLGGVDVQPALADGRQKLLFRLAVLRAVRFYHRAQPKETRPHLVAVMKTLIDQGELADIAIEDLRLWKIWDLTSDVVKLHGRKGVDGRVPPAS